MLVQLKKFLLKLVASHGSPELNRLRPSLRTCHEILEGQTRQVAIFHELDPST